MTRKTTMAMKAEIEDNAGGHVTEKVLIMKSRRRDPILAMIRSTVLQRETDNKPPKQHPRLHASTTYGLQASRPSRSRRGSRNFAKRNPRSVTKSREANLSEMPQAQMQKLVRAMSNPQICPLTRPEPLGTAQARVT